MADKEVLNEFKNNRFDYFNAIMDNKTPIEINRVEKMVLISLIRHNNWKTGICNPTIKTIQNEWFYHNDREIIKALKTLREKNFFTKQTIKRRNYYKLNIALILKDYLQNDGNCLNDGNLQNDGNNNCLNDGNNTCQNEGTNIKETEKEHKNIYSSLENELDTKEIEKDLIKKINSKYSKELIKEELEKLKDKDISKLDLLKELDKNLKSKLKDNSLQDINTIFDYWNSKGIIKHKELKEDTKKAIKKATKNYSIDEIKQAIDTYSEILNSEYYFTYKWSLKDFLNRNNAISTFMEDGSSRANYEEWKNKNKPKEEPKRRGTNLDDL